MKVHIREGDVHLLDIRTRMPFKYGIATMTSTPHAFVRLPVEIDGKPSLGISADHLPPKWFTKDPAKPIADEVAEMLRVIERALQLAAGIEAESPFAAWRQHFERMAAWGRDQRLPPLLTHFGTSLVERAMLDAVCRVAGQPFAHLLRSNAFNIRLGELHPELAEKTPVDLLPAHPLSPIIIRHTVGLADPLEDSDIAPDPPHPPLARGGRGGDGLPQSLAACIQAYGLRHFKIKVSGALDHDRERLERVARVIADHAPADYAFSLDGNEQFHAMEEFRAFWRKLVTSSSLRSFFKHLLFVEQPLHREVALELAVNEPSRDRKRADSTSRPPLIIDESDAELDSLPRALALGYAGTSHKNCKGIFKGIANTCLLEHLRRTYPDRRFILSGEDLANIGPVALLQDLAVCASLGISSVERNGHHYFAGLSMFPREIQQQMLSSHGDLYCRSQAGWPTLNIRGGTVAIQSIVEAPFGVQPAIEVEQFTPLSTWQQTHTFGHEQS